MTTAGYTQGVMMLLYAYGTREVFKRYEILMMESPSNAYLLSNVCCPQWAVSVPLLQFEEEVGVLSEFTLKAGEPFVEDISWYKHHILLAGLAK